MQTPVSYSEKMLISVDITELLEKEDIRGVFRIIQEADPSAIDGDTEPEEFHIDITALQSSTLRKLQAFLITRFVDKLQVPADGVPSSQWTNNKRSQLRLSVEDLEGPELLRAIQIVRYLEPTQCNNDEDTIEFGILQPSTLDKLEAYMAYLANKPHSSDESPEESS